MKKKNVLIASIAILLICASTALAFNLSKKQPEPEIGSYSSKYVAQFAAENKTIENEESDKITIPCYNENELLSENQGCFWLGIDAGSNKASGFRTEFLERMVKMYPNPLVRENEDYIYLVYETDNGSRLFLFYSKEKSNGMMLDGYPIIMKEELLYKDFSEIQVGDSIGKVDSIDSIIPLYIEEFEKKSQTYYERDKANEKYFSSVHLLSDGILKIDYDRQEEDYIVINITYGEDFILEGDFGKTCYKIFKEDYVS